MWGAVFNFLSGGIIQQFTGPLLDAYKAKQQAQNNSERIEAEKDIARLEAARDIAVSESGRAWSATSVGRWLIVVPFGIWWSAIYLIQIINPWFGLDLVVVDVPPRIHDMALILVPAIVIADAGAFAASRFRSR